MLEDHLPREFEFMAGCRTYRPSPFKSSSHMNSTGVLGGTVATAKQLWLAQSTNVSV